jgi:hypothetical protein
MEAITVALITVVGAAAIALIEKGRRENKTDHGVVSDKLDVIAKSLGRSIDRVEDTGIRTEGKLDQHINDHAKGDV